MRYTRSMETMIAGALLLGMSGAGLGLWRAVSGLIEQRSADNVTGPRRPRALVLMRMATLNLRISRMSKKERSSEVDAELARLDREYKALENRLLA